MRNLPKTNAISIHDLTQGDGGLDMARLSLGDVAPVQPVHLDGGQQTDMQLRDGQVVLLANEGVDTRLFDLVQRVMRQGEALLETRREATIDKLVEAALDLVPPKPAELKLQDAVARFRLKFLQSEPCYSSTDLHTLSGSTGRNRSQVAARMKAKQQVFAVRHGDKDLFPAFQFDANGKPWPIMAQVLAALPDRMTPWDIAGWFVRRNMDLGGAVPRDLLAEGDARVVQAAAMAGEGPIG
jgi:hypothetical protein